MKKTIHVQKIGPAGSDKQLTAGSSFYKKKKKKKNKKKKEHDLLEQ